MQMLQQKFLIFLFLIQGKNITPITASGTFCFSFGSRHRGKLKCFLVAKTAAANPTYLPICDELGTFQPILATH